MGLLVYGFIGLYIVSLSGVEGRSPEKFSITTNLCAFLNFKSRSCPSSTLPMLNRDRLLRKTGNSRCPTFEVFLTSQFPELPSFDSAQEDRKYAQEDRNSVREDRKSTIDFR